MINLKKLNQKSASPPPFKTCPCSILPPPFFNSLYHQWCNLTLAWQFWVTKVCLLASKISKISLFGRPTGQATFWEANIENYCISKNLTHFAWYLKKEIGCDIEILSIVRVSNKEHFYGKIMQKMYTKS